MTPGEFELAELVVRPDQNLIESSGQTFRLEPLVMDLLCVLAERAEAVLSRDELLDRTWGRRHGADASLTRAISLLRKTFREAGVDGELIETVPKRGYRLTRQPRPMDHQARNSLEADGRSDVPSARRYLPVGIAGALLVAILAAVGWTRWHASAGKPAAPLLPPNEPGLLEPPPSIKPSVAVLPLVNRSLEPQDAFLADAVHDELLTHLARIGSLKVISRTSVMRFRDTELPLPEIAAVLGVDHVVEGGLQRDGDRIRINVQLIEADSDDHLWAQVYDRELSAASLLDIQTDITRTIAQALDARLSAAERDRLEHRPTDNLAAYQAYLLGRRDFERRIGGGSAELESALKHFHRALELEPGYADALAGIASVHAVYAGYVTDEEGKGSGALAIDYARRALTLDPELAMPHAVLGFLEPAALDRARHLERAAALEPGNATVHTWAAIGDLVAGHLERGERRFLQARELDPTSPVVSIWLGVAADLQGHRERSMAYTEQGMAMGFMPSFGLASTLRFRDGDLAATAELFERVVPPTERQAWRGNVLGLPADPSRRDAAIETILGPHRGNDAFAHFRIAFLIALNAHESVMGLIEQRLSVDLAGFAYVWQAGHPELRRDPRFEILARRIGLPAYWRAAGFPPQCRPVGPDGFACE